jgi:polyphosphate kinase 2 (PPK2 family)
MAQRTRIVLRDKRFRLAALDMDKSIKGAEYDKKLKKLQLHLQRIQQAYLFSNDSAVIVFEGWDAAGKGGTIRRMAWALDPRGFKVWPIGAPRRFHQERHYLYRFWERLPPNGGIAVFDRSWFGRVLVERVEGLTPKRDWQRAYDEINEFERMLIDDGTRVIKLFLHITPEEQARRFTDRLHDPLKRWKLTYDDFRNRGRWDDYESAIEDMVRETSTEVAPWHVVPANHKKRARIDCLSIVAEALAHKVDLSPRPLDEDLRMQASEALNLDEEAVAALEKSKRGRS